MNSFGILILIALITFALSISRDRQCTIKDGKETCCWWNSNTCCHGYKPGQKCGMAFTRCCETHDIIKPAKDLDTSKIKLFPKTAKE